jgi:hypothetical protein
VSATVAVTAVGAAEGARAAAAALACAGAGADRASLLVDLDGRPPRPTLLASAAARELEERLGAHLPRARVAARGQVCHLAVAEDEDGHAAVSAAVTVARGSLAVVHAPPGSVRELLASGRPRFTGVLLRAEVAADRALLSLVAQDLLARGLDLAVLKRRLSWVDERRALFGVLGPDAGIPPRVRDRVLRAGWYDADNKSRKGRLDATSPERRRRASAPW